MGGEGKTSLLEHEDIDEDFVRCKYYCVGCIEKVRKDETDIHELEMKDHHLALLEDTVKEQAEIIVDQRKEIAQQRKYSLASVIIPLLCFFDYVKNLFSKDHASYDDWFQKIVQLIEPTEEDRKKSKSLQGWHLLYLIVFVFIVFSYGISVAATRVRPLAPAQLLPITIFFVFISFHWWHSKYFSSLANNVAAAYLIFVWTILNVLLLPVF